MPVCLAVGGSDSCGGAGVQADLKVFGGQGVHGCTVITALTAQHPGVVSRIEPVSLAQIEAELTAIFDYYEVAAVKTGMLYDAERVALLSALLQQRHGGHLVIDPVMVSSSGRALLDAGGVDALVHALLPLASLITPNLDEAALLLGEPVADAQAAARALSERFSTAVLLKGGHGAGERLVDWLCDEAGEIHRFEHERKSWDRDAAHGTGCRLAAAIAARLAHGDALRAAVGEGIHSLLGA